MLFAEDLPIKITNDAILLNVKITPKASNNRIGKILNNNVKIYVTAAAEAGQANKAVIELLAHELKIAKSYVTIKQGLTQANKVISINGDVELLVKRLQIIISG